MSLKTELPEGREDAPSRRSVYLLVALLLGALATPVLASTVIFYRYESPLGLALGPLPRIEIMPRTNAANYVQLGDLPTQCCPQMFVGHYVGLDNSVWSTVNFGPGTSLFTGVSLISNLLATVRNDGGLLKSGFTIASNQIGGGGAVGPHFGGVLRLKGQMVIHGTGRHHPAAGAAGPRWRANG